jgi:hypothetical protein
LNPSKVNFDTTKKFKNLGALFSNEKSNRNKPMTERLNNCITSKIASKQSKSISNLLKNPNGDKSFE